MNTKKKDIGFDLDDTLLKSAEAIFSFHNERYNTNFTVEQLRHHSVEQLLNISPEDFRAWSEEFYASEHNAQIGLHAGAQEVIRALANDFDVHIVTARGIELASYALYSLGQHFDPGVFTKVHLINSYTRPDSTTKYEVCKAHDIELLVDDYPKHLTLAVENGIHAILIETPWNKDKVVHPGIHRARDLFEVKDIVYELLQ